MKKKLLIFCLIVFGHVGLNAQSYFTDSTIHYRVAFSMDAFNILGQLGNPDHFGPIQLEAQRYLSSLLSVGIQYGYLTSEFDQSYTSHIGDSTITDRYIGTSKTMQFLLKGNYKFQFDAPRSKILQKWGLFAGVGFGYGVIKNHGDLKEPNTFSNPTLEEKMAFFATNFTIGGEIRFKNHLGLYLEGGYALSRLQFGVNYHF